MASNNSTRIRLAQLMASGALLAFLAASLTVHTGTASAAPGTRVPGAASLTTARHAALATLPGGLRAALAHLHLGRSTAQGAGDAPGRLGLRPGGIRPAC